MKLEKNLAKSGLHAYQELQEKKKNSRSVLQYPRSSLVVQSVTVAYAGFSKGGAGNSKNLRVIKTRMKIFQPKIKSVFLPKIR